MSGYISVGAKRIRSADRPAAIDKYNYHDLLNVYLALKTKYPEISIKNLGDYYNMTEVEIATFRRWIRRNHGSTHNKRNANTTFTFTINENKLIKLREYAESREKSVAKVLREYIDTLINFKGE